MVSEESDLKRKLFTISNITGGFVISSFGSSVFIDSFEHGRDFQVKNDLRLSILI